MLINVEASDARYAVARGEIPVVRSQEGVADGLRAVSADADVVVWDPNRAKTLGVKSLHMRIDYSPFEGRTVPGSPSHVLSRGELVVKDDQWVGKTKKGRGQFVRRGTFGL